MISRTDWLKTTALSIGWGCRLRGRGGGGGGGGPPGFFQLKKNERKKFKSADALSNDTIAPNEEEKN